MRATVQDYLTPALLDGIVDNSWKPPTDMKPTEFGEWKDRAKQNVLEVINHAEMEYSTYSEVLAKPTVGLSGAFTLVPDEKSVVACLAKRIAECTESDNTPEFQQLVMMSVQKATKDANLLDNVKVALKSVLK